MTSHRVERVNEFITRELSELVKNEMRDPRLAHLAVMEVRTSSDLSFAKVYITLPENEHKAEAIQALKKAGGFLRTELAKKMNTRTVPKLQFIEDESFKNAARIDELLHKAKPGHPAEE